MWGWLPVARESKGMREKERESAASSFVAEASSLVAEATKEEKRTLEKSPEGFTTSQSPLKINLECL